MKKTLLTAVVMSGILAGFSATVQASTISWTDWTSVGTAASQVFGTISVGASSIGVTYTGPYSFAQTSGGTAYWSSYPTTYTSAEVGNPPPGYDIIALATGGTKTITFSESVKDPILALMSWNGNTVDFGRSIEILNYGQGFWGSGIPVLNGAGTGFYGNGEVHGIIRIPGTMTSISFTDTSENWHGFTLGITDKGGPSAVPEPATMMLFGSGLVCLVANRRRKAE